MAAVVNRAVNAGRSYYDQWSVVPETPTYFVTPSCALEPWCLATRPAKAWVELMSRRKRDFERVLIADANPAPPRFARWLPPPGSWTQTARLGRS